MDDRITVDLDRETYDALSRQAEMHGRSVNEEVSDIVRRSVVKKASEGIDYVAWARRIRAMGPKGVAHSDSVRLIREDRERGHSIDRR
jgi:plasmid stability protein